MIHAGGLLSFCLLFLVSLTVATSRTSPPAGAVVVRQSGTKSGEYRFVLGLPQFSDVHLLLNAAQSVQP